MLTKAASSSLGCSSGHENRNKLTAGAGRLVYSARPACATAASQHLSACRAVAGPCYRGACPVHPWRVHFECGHYVLCSVEDNWMRTMNQSTCFQRARGPMGKWCLKTINFSNVTEDVST